MSSATERARPTHVLSMVDSWSGGAESFAWLVISHLDPQRYRRTLCVTREPEDPDDAENPVVTGNTEQAPGPAG